MSALGTVLGWLGVGERVVRLVRSVWPKKKPEEQAPPHPTWKDVAHIRSQIDSGARAFPARPKPPPRKR